MIKVESAYISGEYQVNMIREFATVKDLILTSLNCQSSFAGRFISTPEPDVVDTSMYLYFTDVKGSGSMHITACSVTVVRSYSFNGLTLFEKNYDAKA